MQIKKRAQKRHYALAAQTACLTYLPDSVQETLLGILWYQGSSAFTRQQLERRFCPKKVTHSHLTRHDRTHGTMRPFIPCVISDTEVPVASGSPCCSPTYVLDARPSDRNIRQTCTSTKGSFLLAWRSILKVEKDVRTGRPAGHDDRRNTFAPCGSRCSAVAASENYLVKSSSLMLPKKVDSLWSSRPVELVEASCYYFSFEHEASCHH
jgi:hypothetical protein